MIATAWQRPRMMSMQADSNSWRPTGSCSKYRKPWAFQEQEQSNGFHHHSTEGLSQTQIIGLDAKLLCVSGHRGCKDRGTVAEARKRTLWSSHQSTLGRPVRPAAFSTCVGFTCSTRGTRRGKQFSIHSIQHVHRLHLQLHERQDLYTQQNCPLKAAPSNDMGWSL